MRDDTPQPGLGKVPDKYDKDFLDRALRQIEKTFQTVLALGPIRTTEISDPSDGSVTIDADVSITGDIAATGNLTLTSTDAGAGSGPVITSVRDSASPAASDILGAQVNYGKDAAGNLTIYSSNQTVISDTTNGSEDGSFEQYAMVAGTLTKITTQNASGLTINSGGLILPQATGPTPTAEGDLRWDTDDDLLVVGDGTNTRRLAKWEHISTQSPSSVASVNFTGLSAYRKIMIVGTFAPATDGVNLLLRTSTNNGVSYDSGATDYTVQYVIANGASVTAVQSSTTSFSVVGTGPVGNAANESISISAVFDEFNQASHCTLHLSEGHYESTAGGFRCTTVWGRRAQATARDAFQILFASGNIASGNVTVWGMRG